MTVNTLNPGILVTDFAASKANSPIEIVPALDEAAAEHVDEAASIAGPAVVVASDNEGPCSTLRTTATYSFFRPPPPGISRIQPLIDGPDQQPGPHLFDRYLDAGYSVPPHLMGKAIDALMRDVRSGASLFHINLSGDASEGIKAYKSQLCFERARIFHRLLQSALKSGMNTVVENGAGSIPYLSFIAADLGSRVFVKEVDAIALDFHRKAILEGAAYLIQVGNIGYSDVDAPVEADIVYWSNPRVIKHRGDISLQAYLGRDVSPGGWLVIQTGGDQEMILCGIRAMAEAGFFYEDHRNIIREVQFPDHEWLQAYAGPLARHGPDQDQSASLLPTLIDTDPQWLHVYYRYPD